MFHIVIEFMNTLKDLEDFNIFDLAKLQEFNKRITELIKNALNQNSNAYLILGKSSFPLTSFMTEVPIIVKTSPLIYMIGTSVKKELTHFTSMPNFDTPWKRQKKTFSNI